MVLTIQANAAHLPLADESVHCCVTSPPYFGLRDYGLPPSVWGGEPKRSRLEFVDNCRNASASAAPSPARIGRIRTCRPSSKVTGAEPWSLTVFTPSAPSTAWATVRTGR